MFGPHEPHVIPRMVKLGKNARNMYIVGTGDYEVDFTYVGNVAYAHALAATKLTPGSKLNGEVCMRMNGENIHLSVRVFVCL
jgi:nucleoside-diphosphate-sugar epimerase